MGHGDRSLLALPAASHHLRGKGDARYLGGYHRPGNAGRRGRRGADFRIDGRLGTPGHGPGVCHAHGRRRGGYARGLFPGRDAARQVRVSRLRRAVRARQYGVPRAAATREGLAMARQRRGEPRGDAGRRGSGRAHSSGVTDRWDVVVVGAGPAGATTALLLARAGASVLLMDRARFPRDKACSEYLSPATTEILERLGGGILDAVEGAAHAKLYGMKVVAPCGAAMCGRFRGGPRPYSFALPRTTFDTILVAAAAREGAIVREGLTVESVVFDGNTAAGVFARSGTASPRWRSWCRSRRCAGAGAKAGTSVAIFSPSSTDFPGSRGGSTRGDWFATFWPPVRSRSGRAPPSRPEAAPCSWVTPPTSSIRSRARGFTLRCGAPSSWPNA